MGRIRKIKNASELIQDYPWLIKTKSDNYFDNNYPVHVEVGMGKGDFLIQCATKFPMINFVGVEIDSTIVLKVCRKISSLVTPLKNLLVLNVNAINLLDWFNQKTITTIYLNFPDPWPKKRHERNRLTSKAFLNIYHILLVNQGLLQFKTDNVDLYAYTLNSLTEFKHLLINYQTNDLYKNAEVSLNNITTEYEKKFLALNKPIHMIRAINT